MSARTLEEGIRGESRIFERGALFFGKVYARSETNS